MPPQRFDGYGASLQHQQQHRLTSINRLRVLFLFLYNLDIEGFAESLQHTAYTGIIIASVGANFDFHIGKQYALCFIHFS